VHRHRVGIVEEQCAGFGNLADVLAEIENHRNVALAIENAARTDGIANALVDAVFQRNRDIGGKGLQPAHTHAAHDVARARNRLAAVGGGGDLRGQFVDRNDLLDDLPDHVEIVRVDVGQCEFDVSELGYFQDV